MPKSLLRGHLLAVPLVVGADRWQVHVRGLRGWPVPHARATRARLQPVQAGRGWWAMQGRV